MTGSFGIIQVFLSLIHHLYLHPIIANFHLMRNRQLEIARLGRENKYSWGIPDNEGFVTFKKKSSERCLQYIFSAFRNKRRPAASAERLCLKSFFPAGPVYSSARAVRPFPSGFTSITMVFPARTPSFKIRRAASVSTFFWRYRFKGRAPYTGS